MSILGIIASGISGHLGPQVTGGTLYTSGGYNYRVFTSNGTLAVSNGTITADILVVAGGGAGGNFYGSGGGAGGVLGYNSQTLSTSYAVTIGAGGANGTTTPSVGLQGDLSQFGSLSSSTGGGGGGNSMVVNIQPPAGYEAKTSQSSSGGVDVLEVMFSKIDQKMAAGISQGNSKTAGAMSQTYGLNRVAGAY